MSRVYTSCLHSRYTVRTADTCADTFRIIAVILAVLALSGAAGASTVDACTTITDPGVYTVSTIHPDTDECVRVESDDVILEGGTFYSSDAAENIVIADGVSDVTIQDVDFSSGERSIVAGDTAGLTLDGNTFTQQDGPALIIDQGDAVDIIDNDFTQVDGLSVDASLTGQVRIVDNTFTQGDDDVRITDADMGTFSVLHNAFSQGVTAYPLRMRRWMRSLS